MEKLNEYLQALLSTCSYELHLEPNKNPYLMSANGATDIANAPLPGTQISMMIFPLIPADVKQQLPSRSEVRFVYAHKLSDFSFVVRKSPSGFNVTICPVLAKDDAVINVLETAPNFPAILEPSPILSNVPFLNSPPIEPGASQKIPFDTFENAPAQQENIFNFDTSSNTAPEIKAASVNLPLRNENFSSGEQKTDNIFFDTGESAATNESEGFVKIAGESASNNTIFAPIGEFNFNGETSEQNFPSEQLFAENAPFQENFTSQSPEPSVQEISSPRETSADFAPTLPNLQAKAKMDSLFKRMAEIGASDLHLSVSMPPMVRKDGKMQFLGASETKLTPESARVLLTSIMPAKNQAEFAGRNDSDFAYEIPGLARFRANIFMDRKGMGAVFRIIPTKILTAEQLGLSPAIMNLCELSKGLVVVTGPTGSGKSTTLCAMIDSINKNREDHIITIEDPIEFTHENQKCLVNQREVHNHTNSFKDALRAALREDPDILLVGEMRDLETISIAIETAETGHLVFGTLHTTTAASTVDRIIDQFPADRQQQIRVMLSESLKGVIAQTLLPKIGGGRIAALEILIVTPAISNLIREGKTFQIASAMQTGKQLGMVMLNDALFALVQKKLVEPRDAYIKAVDKTNFETMLTRGGFKI
jgi:twitching motility protein PilT